MEDFRLYITEHPDVGKAVALQLASFYAEKDYSFKLTLKGLLENKQSKKKG